jgi:cathepsin B
MHVKSTGITTDECLPYVSGSGRVPACPKTCNNGSAIVRVKATKHSSISAKNMQQEIYDNGPIEVAFTVYEDFKNYRSGVYKHVTGAKLGGHAVICIGWGVEGGTPYWLIQNSWGPEWGEQGHFKILRGSNHCGIEGTVYAGYFQC